MHYFYKIRINAKKKSPQSTKYQNANPLNGCGSFPELNEITTGQGHSFFLLLLGNKSLE